MLDIDTEAPRNLTRSGLVLGALVVPGALGVSAISVILPSLSEDLSLSRPEAAWVLASYVLAQAMLVAVFGRLADVRGMRYILVRGAALTVAGTVISVASSSFVPLIAGRLLQGAGAGALWVAAYGTIAARYDGRARAQVLGVVFACLGIISGSGSLIGGVLVDGLSWQVAMAIPLLSLPAAAAVARLAPPAGTARARVDAVGAGLVAVLASALVVLLQAPSIDFAPGVVAGVAITVVVAASMAARRVRSVPDGFLPAAVVRSPRFVFGALAALTIYASYLAAVFAAPPLLLQEHQWSATQVGLLLVVPAMVGAVSARWAGRQMATHDPFRLAATGLGLCAVGLLALGAADGEPVPTAIALSVLMAGFSGGQIPLVDRVPMVVAAEVRSVATGIYTLAFLVGGAIGSATVAGLSDPLGLAGATASVAVFPACGIVLALAAGTAGERSAPRMAVAADHGGLPD